MAVLRELADCSAAYSNGVVMAGGEGVVSGGLLLAPLFWKLFAAFPMIQFQTGWVGLVLAGFLVGVGTAMAPVVPVAMACAAYRAYPRSLVATLCFMSTGFATVYVVRHVLGV
jgi:uncharacterized membrane protein YedE/YeeE